MTHWWHSRHPFKIRENQGCDMRIDMQIGVVRRTRMFTVICCDIQQFVFLSVISRNNLKIQTSPVSLRVVVWPQECCFWSKTVLVHTIVMLSGSVLINIAYLLGCIFQKTVRQTLDLPTFLSLHCSTDERRSVFTSSTATTTTYVINQSFPQKTSGKDQLFIAHDITMHFRHLLLLLGTSVPKIQLLFKTKAKIEPRRQWGSGCVAPLVLNFGTGKRRLGNVRHSPVYSRRRRRR